MRNDIDVRVCEKYALSPEEASVYFHIGINKLRQLINDNPRAEWVFKVGTHSYIKRMKFEKLLDRVDTI